jgi:hypothetical protein
MQNITMSQSLAKSLHDYRNGLECGLVLKAKWVDLIQFPSTDPMDLGNYFEFICTGQIPRDGSIPQAKAKKSGEYLADYAKVHTQKENFNKVMRHYGFSIIETGTKLKYEGLNGVSGMNLGGILDILALQQQTNKKAIIDLKYSALLNDKWSDTGWSEDSLETKDKILIQAITYKFLWLKMFGEEIDFYFFVFSSKKENEYKIFKIEVDVDAYAKLEKQMFLAIQFFEQELQKGFVAKPSYEKCQKCYLQDNCTSKIDFPEIKTIYYTY